WLIVDRELKDYRVNKALGRLGEEELASDDEKQLAFAAFLDFSAGLYSKMANLGIAVIAIIVSVSALYVSSGAASVVPLVLILIAILYAIGTNICGRYQAAAAAVIRYRV